MADHDTLMTITRYGHSKDYVLDAFEQMLDACVVGTPGLNIIWAGDRPNDTIQIPPGLTNCADIVRYSRERTRELAIRKGYGRMLWQGVDALYRTRADFEALLAHPDHFAIVGALISARTDSNHACARRFHTRGGEPLQQQYDVPSAELSHGVLVRVGWPGVENVVIHRSLFDIDIMRRCPEWYQQNNDVLRGRPESRDDNAAKGNLDHSEWFCFEAQRRGVFAWVDTSIKVWHVHESGAPDGGPLARMYPGIERPLSELTWGEA